jgi:pilus assembly protein CpaE
MKIAVVSPNRAHLQAIDAVLKGKGHVSLLVEGGKSRMRELAERDAPDLMLVDGMCCDTGELAQVEYVTTQHPAVAVILMCATHTPEFLINSMRAGVREVLPSPAPTAILEAAVERVAAKLTKAAVSNRGKILAFMPCKGGAGATFLATNIGALLAESRSVLLVDLHLQFGGALSFVHDGEASSNLAVVAKDISRLDASLLAASTVKVSPNFAVLAAPGDVTQGMEVKPEHVDALLTLAVAHYDFIVLDMPRSLDTIAIKALDRAWRVFPVLQSNLADLRNAKQLLDAFRSLGYPADKSEFIVNRYEKSSDIALEQVRRMLGDVVVRTVPNSWREVNTAVNHGDPVTRASRSGSVARQLADLVEVLSPSRDDSRAGLLGRLFRKA